MTGPTNDDRIRDLLHEAVDGVEPGDRLHAIREATAGGGRRASTTWWTVAGAGLAAAAVVVAFALTDSPPSQTREADPAASQSPTASPTATDPPTRGEGLRAAVYYVGDTPDGQRLYREFRRTTAPNSFSAAQEALGLAPLDPDYTSLWPADAITGVSFDGIADDGLIGVAVDPAYANRPPSMTAYQAALALEQVVRTFQAAAQSRAPVQFYADGKSLTRVLGVSAAEPLGTASDLSVLAHVSLSDPSEGQVVDNDDPFTVRGVGNSFEGNVVTRIQRWEGTEVVAEEPTIAGTYEDRLFPFEVTFNLTNVSPGDYLVVSRTDDPSGEGRFHTDTRRITVVD